MVKWLAIETIVGSRMIEPVVEVSELPRRFGDKAARVSVNLSRARGAVDGLVGAKAESKTLLIAPRIEIHCEEGARRLTGSGERNVMRCRIWA